MAWQLSEDIEDALWSACERILPRRARTGRVLREAIVARSRRYTSERTEPEAFSATPVGNRAALDADLAARALFFTPADAAKVAIPLSELARAGLLPESGRLTVIDAGAGVGAMTLGLLDHLRASGALASLQIVVHAIDRDAQALSIMRAVIADLAERWQAKVTLTVECADLECLERVDLRASADLVLAGTVINELDPDVRLHTVQAMVSALRPEGAAIVIEPALRATSRDLHRLRDQLLARQLAHVFAPCTRTAPSCPALSDERDWCHEDRKSNLTPRTASLAGATGLRVHGLKFAYLTLRQRVAAQAEKTGSEQAALRVVSEPRRQKGMRACFVCGEQGRVRIRLLRRRRNPGNDAFEHARRGDVLLVPARLAGGGDVAADDIVECIAVSPS